jgi:hypothetical protein
MKFPCKWHYAAIIRTDVSKERIATVIRVERISVLGTALAVTDIC